MESEHQYSSPTDSGLVMNRKERGAIAAQACETCRNRKQKCSEGRPKCTSCEKLQTPCVYRSPPVTKKDRTLLNILERLKSVENKIDGLAVKDHVGSSYATPTTISSDAEITPLPPTSANSPSQSSSASGYRYASAASQMMDWPKVRQVLESLKNSPMPDGLTLRRTMQISSKPLPLGRVHAMPISSDGSLNVNMAFAELEYSPATINWDVVHRLSKAFFDTYNLVHHILDRDAFGSNIPNVMSCGFGEDIHTVLLFLVLALGEFALSVSSGFPVLIDKGHSADIDVASTDRPPGMVYFNEARKRMGFVLAESSLENVQMFSLAALYYDSCGQCLESRRLAATASLACQSLITR
jgi:hypothetical protein